MGDNFIELSKIQSNSIEKYTYFLLAAAGAAIGYSLGKTDNKLLGWNLLPLGISVICWGLSFYCGCRQLVLTKHANFANLVGLKMASEEPNNIPRNNYINELIEKKFNELVSKSGNNGVRQFSFFIIGVVFYVLWYVLELYLKTYPHSSFARVFSFIS